LGKQKQWRKKLEKEEQQSQSGRLENVKTKIATIKQTITKKTKNSINDSLDDGTIDPAAKKEKTLLVKKLN